MNDTMSYPLGAAESAGSGLASSYANLVKTFNDIYQQNQSAPFENMQRAASANYTNEQANATRILTPLRAQEMLNQAKAADIGLASANLKLQEQHRGLRQSDEELSGYAEFNNSLSDFVTPDGSYDLQSLTETNPPLNMTPFQRKGWIKARDEVFAQAGQADYLGKVNQIKQMNSQTELGNQFNIAQAKQEMATLGMPVDEDSVNNYLKTVIYPRRQAELQKAATIATSPNIIPNAKGGYTVIKNTGTTTGMSASMTNAIAKADNTFIQGVDSFIDNMGANGKSLMKNLDAMRGFAVNKEVIQNRKDAIEAVNNLHKQLKDAADEIHKAESKTKWAFGFGGHTPEQNENIKLAHARYDAIEQKIQNYKEILKTPILEANKAATGMPTATQQASQSSPKQVEQATSDNQDEILADARRAIQSGKNKAMVKKRLQEMGIDPSLLDKETTTIETQTDTEEE